ncbi:MAG: general stress protein [Rickettsiales bacterium]
MKIVTGSFDNRANAERAIDELLDRGFMRDDISLVMSDRTRDTLFTKEETTGDKAAKGGITGAAATGAAGALLAGLSAVGSIVIPGAGLLAVGPLVAALTGAGAGAAVGGLTGALLAAGFAEDDAKLSEDEIRRGRAVVVVHSPDAQSSVARSVLRDSGAEMTKAA